MVDNSFSPDNDGMGAMPDLPFGDEETQETQETQDSQGWAETQENTQEDTQMESENTPGGSLRENDEEDELAHTDNDDRCVRWCICDTSRLTIIVCIASPSCLPAQTKGHCVTRPVTP